MSYQDHYRTCPYCNKGLSLKPTIRVKSASSREKERKLIDLGNMVRGIQTKTKGASYGSSNYSKVRSQGPIEKAIKLKELAKIIRGSQFTKINGGLQQH
jgi:hypothetical protein